MSTTAPATDSTTGTPEHAPPQWIYRNLTPWRIHACFRGDRSLLPRCADSDHHADHDPECDHDVVKVLSIPALGEVKVPREDSYQYNTLAMRRLGQIEVRPSPSELWTNLPRAIVIFGWLGVALFVGGRALFAGGASGVPWAAVVAMVVAVPVLALVVATLREIGLYRRFDEYRHSLDRENNALRKPTAPGPANEQSLEGIERGEIDRLMLFLPPRHGKSLITSQLFPPRYLGRHPDRSVIASSMAKSWHRISAARCVTPWRTSSSSRSSHMRGSARIRPRHIDST